MDLRGLMVAIKTSPCSTGSFCEISGLVESKNEWKQEATPWPRPQGPAYTRMEVQTQRLQRYQM